MLSLVARSCGRRLGGGLQHNMQAAMGMRGLSVAARVPFRSAAGPRTNTASLFQAARTYSTSAGNAAAKPKRKYVKTKIFLTLWALVAIADNIINDDWDTLIDRIRPGLSEEKRKDRPHIVILGTGWGALSMLRKLRADQFNVTIVSPRNYFLFTPLLPSTTTGFINTEVIIEPIRDYCRRVNASHSVVYEAECYEVVPETNTIRCKRVGDDGDTEGQFELAYDHLIVATGCQTATFGIPGVQEHAYFMKEAPDSHKLRNHILDVLETCNLPNADKIHDLNKLLHFVVVGGGPTGVECAAELHDFVTDEVLLFFPHLADKIRITLVEAQGHVLSMFSRSLVEYAEEKFKRESINVWTNALVTNLDKDFVTVKHLETKETEKVPYGTLLWASGVATRPVVRQLIERLGKEKGQTSPRALVIDQNCRVKGTSNIWALGDAAFSGLPPTAQVAGQQGKYLGRLLRNAADALYRDKLQATSENFEKHMATAAPFQYQHMGSFAYIGESSAIADFTTGKDEQVGPLGTSAGVTTYFIWRSVYFTKLLSFRNRCLLGMNWAFTWIFGRDTSRTR